MRDYVVIISVNDAVTRTVARKLRAEHFCCKIEPVGTPAAAVQQAEAGTTTTTRRTAGAAR